MKKIAIIYSPKGGNVDKVSNIICGKFNPEQVILSSITDLDKQILEETDYWLVGGSTVGSHNWEDAEDINMWHTFFKLLDTIDMKTKTVAFFGLGDQILYPHHFVDSLGEFQEEFSRRNTNIIGKWPVEGYTFTDSEGVENDMFYGLALDEDNEAKLTEGRIDKWLKGIKQSFGV